MAVYLIHFHRPISPDHPCQHYIGFSENLQARIRHHRNGTSKVRLFEVAKERGVGFDVVKIWQDGDRVFERKLKNQKNHRRYCPICSSQKKE